MDVENVKKIKRTSFFATVESVLLYGAETWSINKAFQKKINGCYTRLLRMAMNISWTQRLTNAELYQNIPPVTDKIRKRRMMLAGHCVRHVDEAASDLVLWEPTDGRVRRGRRKLTYIDNLKEDTGANDSNEIRSMMLDRNGWKARVSSDRRPGGRPR